MPTLAFYKPYGVLCQFSAEGDTPTLAGYISVPRVYPAGRLDKDSEGLLILTDDGRLAHHITSPEHHLEKVYLVQVERIPTDDALKQLRAGVRIEGRLARPVRVNLLSPEPDLPPRSVPIRYRKNVPTAWLEIVLHEGKKHQVRRMTAAVGHPTLRLVRIAEGPITLAGLQPGKWRELSPNEVRALLKYRKSVV